MRTGALQWSEILGQNPHVLEGTDMFTGARAVSASSCQTPHAHKPALPGKAVMGHELVLYTRIRAHFSTVALVCLRRCTHWKLQDCEAIVVGVSGWMHQRFTDRVAPASLYRSAFLHAIQSFVEAVVTNGMTLFEAAKHLSQGPALLDSEHRQIPFSDSQWTGNCKAA